MIRHRMDPRPGYLERVEADGLAYAVDRSGTGAARPYWCESAAYEFTEAQITELEDTTATLHAMCVEAASHLLDTPRLFATLGLPAAVRDLMRHSLATERDRTLYGRFDLAWDGESTPRLLEYNADTPAGLHEAAVTQWTWLDDVLPGNDQWNMLPELLSATWRRLGRGAPDGRVHLAFGQGEPSEDWVTVAYLADAAADAGLAPVVLTMEDLGWHSGLRRFVDVEERPVHTCFAMYPWEWMLTEPFGERILSGEASTRWIEPVWKTLLSAKTILVALTECFPGHPNLIPASLDHPRGDFWVSKPVFGWEGAGIDVCAPDFHHLQPDGATTGQPLVYQDYHRLPVFGGARPVLGTWVVGGAPAGLGIRESDGPVTDAGARFVPHFLSTPRSTPEQVDRWVREAIAPVEPGSRSSGSGRGR
ncbi:MAG: Glutathionylspermidine synthase family protein [Actinomycetota bacterium]|nr:Glutathionylspermidine synthase family protein [Actinomycetota bacterium]